jgi:hypothetical protein
MQKNTFTEYGTFKCIIALLRKVSINSTEIYLTLKIASSREKGHKAKLEHFRGNKEENCQQIMS